MGADSSVLVIAELQKKSASFPAKPAISLYRTNKGRLSACLYIADRKMYRCLLFPKKLRPARPLHHLSRPPWSPLAPPEAGKLVGPERFRDSEDRFRTSRNDDNRTLLLHLSIVLISVSPYFFSSCFCITSEGFSGTAWGFSAFFGSWEIFASTSLLISTL